MSLSCLWGRHHHCDHSPPPPISDLIVELLPLEPNEGVTPENVEPFVIGDVNELREIIVEALCEIYASRLNEDPRGLIVYNMLAKARLADE